MLYLCWPDDEAARASCWSVCAEDEPDAPSSLDIMEYEPDEPDSEDEEDEDARGGGAKRGDARDAWATRARTDADASLGEAEGAPPPWHQQSRTARPTAGAADEALAPARADIRAGIRAPSGGTSRSTRNGGLRLEQARERDDGVEQRVVRVRARLAEPVAAEVEDLQRAVHAQRVAQRDDAVGRRDVASRRRRGRACAA